MQACPTGVLTVTHHGPRLATGCVECGQCAAACPNEALALPGFALRAKRQSGAVAVDCWRVPRSESPVGAIRVPCLGGLTATDLLELSAEADGRPVALLDRGFCARCPAGAARHPVEKSLATVQGWLQTLRIPPLHWPRLTQWPLPPERMVQESSEPLLEARVSRRGLFVGLAEIVEPAPPQDRGAQDRPSRRLAALARLEVARPFPAALFPALSANDQCADHQVCVAACPTGALRRYREDSARGLAFDAERCTGCGLCMQLCPSRALTMAREGPAATHPGPSILTRFRVRSCPDCDADYTGDGPVCPACASDQAFAQEAFRTLFGAVAPHSTNNEAEEDTRWSY